MWAAGNGGRNCVWSKLLLVKPGLITQWLGLQVAAQVGAETTGTPDTSTVCSQVFVVLFLLPSHLAKSVNTLTNLTSMVSYR